MASIVMVIFLGIFANLLFFLLYASWSEGESLRKALRNEQELNDRLRAEVKQLQG